MSREKQNDELVQMYRDLGEIFDEEYEKRRLITPQNTAEKLTAKGYHKQEWISVDERLPEDGVWVLGYSAKSGRGGLCNCLKSYVREFGNYDDTTHWLPLPEFPKKKG